MSSNPAGTIDTVANAVAETLRPLTPEILAKVRGSLPPLWAPVFDTYAPALARMAVAEIWEWIRLVETGNDYAAKAALLAKLDNAALIAEWNSLGAAWAQANVNNAASLSSQRMALGATIKVALGILLMAMGF